eukprot:SAG11_NODE_15014_length_591_cov_1.434959_1_plen_116_part_10
MPNKEGEQKTRQGGKVIIRAREDQERRQSRDRVEREAGERERHRQQGQDRTAAHTQRPGEKERRHRAEIAGGEQRTEHTSTSRDAHKEGGRRSRERDKREQAEKSIPRTTYDNSRY